jgi:hypothetical protein
MPTVTQLLKSKTVWAGLLTGIAGVVQYATPFVPPQYTAIALGAAGLLQIALRAVTTQPLKDK